MTEPNEPLSGVETQALGKGPLSQPRTAEESVRFRPGSVIAGRYRVIDPLGHGGMGEVLRAEDLSLRQTVALKFLPPVMASDERALDRLREEVRMARRVSHPSVCRVHDIGEADSQLFISMEYVDGEDLAVLLRRVGRLAGDRALEIARELCAGLAAAHAAGVIHRDLKPANVMLDRAGHVRITDFGLALPREDGNSGRELAGTPAYMAPEQLAGMGATVRSDLYALGLVLYELFTGQRTCPDATSLSELIRLRRDTPLVPPGRLVRDLDPVVERTILRCLMVQPDQRPDSALAVLTELSGDDPMQAALAAGQTPSPSAVAAAKVVGALSPMWAWLSFGVVLAVLGLHVAWLGARFSVLERLRPPFPPSVLEVKAEEAMRALGHEGSWADAASGFEYSNGALLSAASSAGDPGKRAEAAAAGQRTIQFWHRCSPVPLQPSGPYVGRETPPLGPGEVLIVLDVRGRLLRYVHVPAVGSGRPGAPDPLAEFLRLTGSGVAEQSIPTIENGRLTIDTRIDGIVPAKVEADFRAGRLLGASVVPPWTAPVRLRSVKLLDPGDTIPLFRLLFNLASLFLATRNLRTGLGDRRGAWRIGLLVLGCFLLSTLLEAHHTGTFGREEFLFKFGLAWGLYYGTTTALTYLALEPFVRRVWPERLVSWTRLLAGRVRDPMVARDVLLAMASLFGVIGLAELCMLMARNPSFYQTKNNLRPLFGLANSFAAAVDAAWLAFWYGLGFLLLLLLLHPFRRIRGLAPVLFVGLVGGMVLAGGVSMGVPLWAGVPLALAFAALFYFQLTRLGLLAMVAAFFLIAISINFPNAARLTGWTSLSAWWLVGITVLGALYGVYFSTGGRPFGDRELFKP